MAYVSPASSSWFPAFPARDWMPVIALGLAALLGLAWYALRRAYAARAIAASDAADRLLRTEIERRHTAERELTQLRAEFEMRLRERTSDLAALAERLVNDVAVRDDAVFALHETQEMRERLLAIVESTPDFVGIVDFEERLQYVNAAGRRMIGLHPDDNVSRYRLGDFWTRPSYERLVTEGVPAALEHGVWTAEMVIVTRDGQEVPVSQVVIAHGLTERGGPRFLSTVVRDTSTQRQLEAQLRESQKMEAVGRLAGGVAHDFNNILTTIIAAAEILLDDLPSDTPSHGDVREIRAAADRAATLTRQLLAYSRRQTLQPHELEINTVVSNTETTLRRLLGDRIVLRCELDARSGNVRADLSQLEQVLIHLCANARDAMPGGGRVTIATSAAVYQQIAKHEHGLIPAGAYSALTVTDTGHGMDPDTAARCFEPFFTTKPPGLGAGLGLATVYGIVRQSGGYIWCASTPGRGSVFTVLLPRLDVTLGSNGHSAANAGDASGAETVLLVEDEESVRRITAKALRRRGFTILEAASGPEALAVAEQYERTIDVLLTDVVMPGMNGAKLARELLQRRPTIKILFASGYAGNALGEDGIIDHGTAFIQKPFTSRMLEEKIREVVGR
jgi:two-component system cell cycle sensor histidine kinase/response regulator CckA